MNEILIICGPTASGKSELSVKCAKKLNSEIIYADSVSVYKGFDIGSAKPTLEEMDGVKHHLIDVAQPTDYYSVSDYSELALQVISQLHSQGKIPIICGGTGQYIDSILYKSSYGNIGKDDKIRNKYNALLKEKGKDYLYQMLQTIDKKSAETIHPNDTKRVIRAIEIYEAGGLKKSEIIDSIRPRFKYSAVCIDYPRNELYERINARVDNMLQNGLIEEVVGLLKKGLNKNLQAMQAIGYKEVVQFLNNEVSHNTMSDIIKKNTRNYAKRQLTYFRKLKNLHYLKPEAVDDMVNKVISLL